MEISQKDFEASEIKMNELLAIATQKGGFDNLTSKERAALDNYTQKEKRMKTSILRFLCLKLYKA